MKKIIEISKPAIGKEEIEAVISVLKKAQLSQGPLVRTFEEKFAKYCGAKYAVAMINGTATLHSALNALGLQENDEVIVPSLTYISTANSIIMQGAKVVFCDIQEETYNINPKKIKEKITKNTKVIMPVDLYGHMYDIEEVNLLTKKYNLKIIEDAAQSVGAEYEGKKAGAYSDVASYSLYATKNLTAGLGGILITNDKKNMEKCKLFRNHGQPEKKPYEFEDFGYNYRMNDMLAAIALEQLKKIENFTKIRRENARVLSKGLKDIEGLILPKEKPGYRHVFHQYTIRITKDFKLTRDKFIEFMKKKGIACRIYYHKPLHFYPHLMRLGYKKGDFPIAEKVASEVVSLPVHPLLTEKDMQDITKTIKSI